MLPSAVKKKLDVSENEMKNNEKEKKSPKKRKTSFWWLHRYNAFATMIFGRVVAGFIAAAANVSVVVIMVRGMWLL